MNFQEIPVSNITNPTNCETSWQFNLILNTLLHVTILFLIISTFFEVYVSKIITEALNGEIVSNVVPLVKEKIEEVNQTTSGTITEAKRAIPFSKLYELYGKPTNETVNNNEWVTKIIIILNVFLFLIILTMVLTSYQAGQCPPIRQLLLENLITFIFVGVIEASFFIMVISKYIPTSPTVVSTAAVGSIKRNLTTKK